MAQEVVWLPSAIDDVEAIAGYISKNSSAYASIVVQRLLSSARDLAEFPRVGRLVPEWNDPNIRERIVFPYRLIYQTQSSRVLVLAVIHGARLLPDEIRERGVP